MNKSLLWSQVCLLYSPIWNTVGFTVFTVHVSSECTLPISSVNNSIRVETVWCPDGSSIINISPDCGAHFSLWWSVHPPTLPPPINTSEGTVVGPCSILVSNHRALELSVLHLHVKTSPGSGCKGPNLEWQSSARDSWSTKKAWLSSSSQSPAAPLTHRTPIQQKYTGDREGCCHAHFHETVEEQRMVLYSLVTNYLLSIIVPLLEHETL